MLPRLTVTGIARVAKAADGPAAVGPQMSAMELITPEHARSKPSGPRVTAARHARCDAVAGFAGDVAHFQARGSVGSAPHATLAAVRRD
jgi:hypothetical protein